MNDAGTELVTRYFFVHLQKTAGTALLKRLRHHFGPDAVYPRPTEQGTPMAVLDVDHLCRVDAARPGAYQVLTGHFPLGVIDLLAGPFATFTVLRDPVERVLSFLRHQREVEPRFAAASLEAVYDDAVSRSGLVDNHMVKMLSLRGSDLTAGALTPVTVDDAWLHRAEAALEERIDVMGLQEHFDVFCQDLERRFGWDLGPPLFMNRTSPAVCSDSLRERITLDNRFDELLYGHAVELWHGRHR